VNELGIWSEAAGGVIEAQLYSATEALAAVGDLVAAGEEPDDLSVVGICREHGEHAASECEDDETEEEL